ncbi:MAG: formamidopyrimidine-DNA glycosylase [Planctomycetes bacterium]|nr:formamidopyrimidine-DNA glycosylase [Planctomycetota bacterium]
MPELPDVTVYIDALRSRLVGRVLEKVRIKSPSALRTYDPSIFEAHGRTVAGLSRMGKRIVVDLDDELFLVIHLMIAGRFRYAKKGANPPGKMGLASFDFDTATLHLTEASTKKRAGIWLVRGTAARDALDPGGLEPLEATRDEFGARLVVENRTLKRALTDPHLFSGIGNAYSDEILHAARLSPTQLTRNLDDDETTRLHAAVVTTLEAWISRLRDLYSDKFPTKVTAFRPDMAVHGKYGEPCPVCQTPVQRLIYASNEANYCPTCQTNGKLLRDRGLSKLLKDDWPKTLEELEERRRGS